jgi:hypothetical protein
VSLNRVLRPIGLVVGVGATAAFVWYAMRELQARDLSHFASLRAFAAIAVAGLCYATIIPMSALGWGALLRGLGLPQRWRSLVEILAISQFAKYIPGNVGAHLGRAGMAVARGIGPRVVVASLLTETLLVVAAALAVGTTGILFSRAGAASLAHGALREGLVPVAWVLGGIAVLALTVRFAPTSLRARIAAAHAWPPLPQMLHAFAAYASNYIVIGIGTWLMAALLLPGLHHDIGLLTAGFALAWVAGFFAPGAPAGLGIREALMLVILRTSYSAPDALFIVVGLRLATVLADVLIFLVGNAAALLSRRRSALP